MTRPPGAALRSVGPLDVGGVQADPPERLGGATARRDAEVFAGRYPLPAKRQTCATTKQAAKPAASGNSADTAVHRRLPVSL